MELLEHRRWGFESDCFVCERRDDAGSGIEFYRDPDTETVTASFEGGNADFVRTTGDGR